MKKDSIIYSLDNVESIIDMLIQKTKDSQILTLTGDLGAGKTTLAKQLIHRLTGICVHDIASPTYTYLNAYKSRGHLIHHFDLYRLSSYEDFENLGLLEELQKATLNIVEWPDILNPILENYNTTNLHLDHHSDQTRSLCFSPCGGALAL